MIRFRALLLVVCASLVLAFAAGLQAASDEEKKGKPKDAAILDDATATLTETVDGKEKKTKIDLNYCLKVKGYFQADGFHIDEVDAGGPAATLSNADTANAQMEKGDIITEVDGKRIKSAQDYAKAMNSAADHAKTKVKVRDVNSGQEAEFDAAAAKR
jgi:membrane-associated protease RseP (regulator of RpoE activity)